MGHYLSHHWSHKNFGPNLLGISGSDGVQWKCAGIYIGVKLPMDPEP